MEDLQARLVAAIDELEASADDRERRLLPLLRDVADAVDDMDGERAMHEAVQAQHAAQRELILALGCPILQVRSDALCVPLMGPYDIDRATQLSEAVLAATSRGRARLVVFDLSAAHVPEPSAAEHLFNLCHAVRLLGARAALTGVQPGLARLLVDVPLALGAVTLHLSLESALQATPS